MKRTTIFSGIMIGLLAFLLNSCAVEVEDHPHHHWHHHHEHREGVELEVR